MTFQKTRYQLAIVITAFLQTACSNESAHYEQPIRGLRAFEVSTAAQYIERRFPGIVQPHDETTLAFEVSGQLESINLKEGQFVARDQTILSLNTTTFNLHVEESRASLDQARAQHRNAKADFERQAELWKKRVIPRSAYDNAKAMLDTTSAQVDQTSRRLEIAQDNLAKTALTAPFDGYVANVEVDAFATVSAGRPVLTLYADDAFETEISVTSDVINTVSTGQAVAITVSELANAKFQGIITEIGARARNVAAFPAVGVFNDPGEMIKAGMSAEVAVQLALSDRDEGFLIPITCLTFDAIEHLHPDSSEASVFVYDSDTSTVHNRTITISEIRENSVIVHGGLEAGELVASAGVSYLRDGQRVQLLDR